MKLKKNHLDFLTIGNSTLKMLLLNAFIKNYIMKTKIYKQT